MKSESRTKINRAWADEVKRLHGDEGAVNEVKDTPDGILLFGEYLTGRCGKCGNSGFVNRVIESELVRTCKKCSESKRVG